MLRSLSSIPTPNISNFNFFEEHNFGISKDKVYFPGTPVNYFEAELLVQELGPLYSLPTSVEMRIAQRAGKIKIDRRSELTDSLIAYPNQNNVFTKRVRKPALERGGKPKLLEGSTVIVEGGEYFIEGSKSSELECVVSHEGKVRKDVKSLGILKGETLFMERDLCGDDGLRVVACFDGGAMALFHPLNSLYNGFYMSVKGGRQRMLENYL